MSKSEKTRVAGTKYRQVKISSLRKGRRGKHHDLVQQILKELEGVPAGSALEVPLNSSGVGLANMRSAIHRGAAAKGLDIETLAEENNFYVFKKDPATNGDQSEGE